MADINDVKKETVKAEAPALIQLFEIDLTFFGGGIQYLASDTTPSYEKIIFGDTQYNPFPIAITGISESIDGAPARPQLIVSNVNKLFAALVYANSDILGAKITYIRTFSNYLNLGAGQRPRMPDLKFVIGQKLKHDRQLLMFSLRRPTDKENAYHPKRQMLRKQFPGLGTNKRVR